MGNPGIFARKILRECHRLISESPASVDLKTALETGAQITVANGVHGASTFSLAVLRDDKLVVLNLGDSGFTLFRPAVWYQGTQASVYARWAKDFDKMFSPLH